MLMSLPIIWIIDDNAVNLLVLRRLAEKVEGATVLGFDHPDAALKAAQTERPALLVLDYMMPSMDGLDFAGRFRAMAAHKEVPILMVTSAPDRDVRYRMLSLGLVDFLNKPVDSVEFVARVRNMLHLSVALSRLSSQNAALSQAVDVSTANILERERESLLMLGRAAEFRDPETGAHIQRMAAYSELIARKVQNQHSYKPEDVRLAAPMHDVGKIGIPNAVLLKPGRYDAVEWAQMKQHAEYGYRILDTSESPILRMGAVIALSHHESWDGTGYPYGLKGEAIPILGRIVAVADVFDALTSARPYKQAWTEEKAFEELQNMSGAKLDPSMVNAFLACKTEIREIRMSFAVD
jgi:putative two-component system response regulator